MSDVVYVSQEIHESMSGSQLKELDVLLNITGASIGRCTFVPKGFGEANVNQHVCIIRPNEKVDSVYLSQWLASDFGQNEIMKNQAGGNREGLNFQQIKSMEVTLPLVSEQQKIAAILTSVDDVIEKTQAQINKLKDLKTGMMQELLTRGVGVDGKPHTEFKDSSVGCIPKGWDVVTLKDLIKSMLGGVSVNADNRIKMSDELGVLKVSSVYKGCFIPHEHKTVLKEEEKRVKITPLKDHILFSRANTPERVGECGYVEQSCDDLFLPDKIWMIDVKDRKIVNVRWLSYILSSGRMRRLISDVATGTSGSMKNISKPNLLALELALPNIDEQCAIANVIHSLDKNINLIEKKLQKTLSLKKALMQDLLTGKVRVNVD